MPPLRQRPELGRLALCLVLLLGGQAAVGLGVGTAGAAAPQLQQAEPTPTPTTNESSTPTPGVSVGGGPAANVPSSNNTSGGGGGALINIGPDIPSWGDVKSWTMDTGSKLIRQLAYSVVFAASWTPLLKNWPGIVQQAHANESYLWIGVIVGGVWSLLKTANGVASGQNGISPMKRWAWRSFVAVSTLEIIRLWLQLRRGVTEMLLQDATSPGLETTLTAVAVILIFIVFLSATTGFALLLIMITIGSGAFIIYLTPWMEAIAGWRTVPNSFISGSADALWKLFFVMSLSSLPLVIGVGASFSIEVAPQIADMQQTAPTQNTSEAVKKGTQVLIALGGKFGALIVSVVGTHYVYEYLTSLTNAPKPEVVVSDTVQGARESGGTVVIGGREAFRGVRGKGPSQDERGRAFDLGRSVRQTGTGLRDGSWSSSSSESSASDSSEDTLDAAEDRADNRQND